MSKFAQRLAKLPSYPMAELPAIKRRLLQQGVDVIDLGAGDADFAPPAVGIEALQRGVQGPAMSRYAFQLGHVPFREGAAADFKRRGRFFGRSLQEGEPPRGADGKHTHLPR